MKGVLRFFGLGARPPAPPSVLALIRRHPGFEQDFRSVELAPEAWQAFEREMQRLYVDGRPLWTCRIVPGPASVIEWRPRGGKFECLPWRRDPLDVSHGEAAA